MARRVPPHRPDRYEPDEPYEARRLPPEEPIVAAGIEYDAPEAQARPDRPLPPEDYPASRAPDAEPYAYADPRLPPEDYPAPPAEGWTADPYAREPGPPPEGYPVYRDPGYPQPGAELDRDAAAAALLTEDERTIELREEQLVARKELREVGEVEIRTEVDEVPGRLEVDALRQEVEVEHVPVGEVVRERVAPWEEDGVLIVPVYEEQLVVSKRLVLREHLRIRRVETSERRLFEDTLRRERLVIEDPNNTGLVHEQYPTDGDRTDGDRAKEPRDEGGPLGALFRKVLQ
jgi:uncharacterized protein (TIGR02271 family)